uniref:Uncharacterized protein n=1 Tax=Setaria italica TaxID=4555 RepID=K4A464_SETIT
MTGSTSLVDPALTYLTHSPNTWTDRSSSLHVAAT